MFCHCRFCCVLGMLAANSCYLVTCQSCCQSYQLDHLSNAVECARFISYKCVCKLTACNLGASHVSQAVTSKCPQSRDIVNAMQQTGELPSVSSVSSGIRHVRCTCGTESQLSLATAHCTACVCHRGSKAENLIHIVGCDESLNSATADHYHYQHHYHYQQCCTCIGSCSHECQMSTCHRSTVTLSDVTVNVCPGCTKFTPVNTPEHADHWLTSRHSDLCRLKQDREKISRSCGQSGNVSMNVSEWQRRHIEQLDRQKQEVCDTSHYVIQFLSEM